MIHLKISADTERRLNRRYAGKFVFRVGRLFIMTKINIVVAAFVFGILIESGTVHASPVNSPVVSAGETQSEIVQLSAWPRIRNSLLGRESHRNPPPPPRDRFGSNRGPHFNPPPPREGHRGYPPRHHH